MDHEKEMVERVARAIECAERQQFVELVDAVEWSPAPFRKLIQQCLHESDRAAAILLFSNIEDALSENLKVTMRREISDLFDYPSGLADFSSKLKLIYGLKWIGKDLYDNLRILMKIRNLFAHRIDIHSFDHDIVLGMISSMNFKAKNILVSSLEENSKLSPRTHYLTAAIFSFEGLWRALLAGPIMSQVKYQPGSLTGESGQPPNNFKRTMYAASALACEVCDRVDFNNNNDFVGDRKLQALNNDEWEKSVVEKSLKFDWKGSL